MYKKLFKYEFKSTYREAGVLLSIYLGLCLLSTFFIAVTDISNGAANFFFEPLLLVFILGLGIILFTVVRIIIRIFWNGLFGKSAYLLFSIPATNKQIILSKVLISLFWLLVISVVYTIGVLLNVIVLTLRTDGYGVFFVAILKFINDIFEIMGYSYIIDLVLSIGTYLGLVLFVSVFSHTVYKGGKKVIIALLLAYAYLIVLSFFSGGFLSSTISYYPNPNSFSLFRGLSYIVNLITIFGSYFFSIWALNHKLEIN
ncbi:MAG: hypothetical protein LBV58_01725 [Acholeplasmatales bacterium]|jgi:hypothetical protein|nr:hypothetical protein [Acholeplasmatales bacterium]